MARAASWCRRATRLAIADAVLRICEDRALRDRMATSAAREAERYSMAAWETRFIAAVRDAL